MNDVIIWWSMFLQFTIDALGFFPITEKSISTITVYSINLQENVNNILLLQRDHCFIHLLTSNTLSAF